VAKAKAKRKSAGSASERALERRLTEARRERDEYLELAKRAKADFENYRRRSEERSEQAALRAREMLAERLFPVLDTFEQALAALSEAELGSELLSGLQMTGRQLEEALAGAGIESYDPLGESFDPAWHEAVERRDGGGQPGEIAEVYSRGYRSEGRCLRAARVAVFAS
jgi:molecular chaperone GrpE